MRSFFSGKPGGLMVFLLIALLVAGGLGWVTHAALELEREQFAARADLEMMQMLHVALWRLDSRLSPVLARESGRPYKHYSPVYVPSVVLRADLQAWQHGSVLVPSPLLNAELPEWMLLHFQTDEETTWESPQVLGGAQRRRLTNPGSRVDLANVTDERRQLLDELQITTPSKTVFDAARDRGVVASVREMTFPPATLPWDNGNTGNNGNNTDLGPLVAQPQGNGMPMQSLNSGGRGSQEFANRFSQQSRVQKEVNPTQMKEPPEVAINNFRLNNTTWQICEGGSGDLLEVQLTPLVPIWLTPSDREPRLVWTRLVTIEGKQLCQGIVLDWPRLQALLTEEIEDLFPGATFEPVLPGMTPDPDRTMGTLHAQLVPRPEPPPVVPAWTPLRIGLAMAWAAALVALGAVGLGGWSLLDLSERRIRFVSAVTHELRTPLTTLRLYLDMLTGGMVKEPAQKEEYLHTLNAEADRLNRLVGNVLDFSRLENQRPRLQMSTVSLGTLLDGVRETWQGRCQDAGKELVVETTASPETLFETDLTIAQQVLGNLVDNACKYSKGAADRRLWVRAALEGKRLLIEVEDRGPGVTLVERRSIFQPFRRGKGADTVGGVGLGLALADRWTQLLGGRLTLSTDHAQIGACFRLELPVV